MDFKSRINLFKENNPELTQRTLRLSKEDAKKVDALAKREKIKSGHCLRILVEDAIARELRTEDTSPPKETTTVQRKEFEMLKTQVENLTKELGGLPSN